MCASYFKSGDLPLTDPQTNYVLLNYKHHKNDLKAQKSQS